MIIIISFDFFKTLNCKSCRMLASIMVEFLFFFSSIKCCCVSIKWKGVFLFLFRLYVGVEGLEFLGEILKMVSATVPSAFSSFASSLEIVLKDLEL